MCVAGVWRRGLGAELHLFKVKSGDQKPVKEFSLPVTQSPRLVLILNQGFLDHVNCFETPVSASKRPCHSETVTWI